MPDAGEAVWQSCTLLLNFDLFIQTGRISSAPVSPIKLRQSHGKLTGIRMEGRRLSIVEFVMHLGINRDTIWQWVKQKQAFAHKVGRLRKFMALEAKE